MIRLRDAFRRPTLVGYLVGGHPDADACVANACALIEGGVGVLELGIPHTDPIADGPTIQAASTVALELGVTPSTVLDVAARVHDRHPEVPILLMTYVNIPYRLGFKAFAARAIEAGVSGVIFPDLPLDERDFVGDALSGLDVVLLASPAGDDARIERLARATEGFLYLVGLYGVTGARGTLSAETVATTRRAASIARAAGVPLAVGFGVSRAEHAARLVAAGADGVVVGSAFVERAADAHAADALRTLANGIADGLGEPVEK